MSPLDRGITPGRWAAEAGNNLRFWSTEVNFKEFIRSYRAAQARFPPLSVFTRTDEV